MSLLELTRVDVDRIRIVLKGSERTVTNMPDQTDTHAPTVNMKKVLGCRKSNLRYFKSTKSIMKSQGLEVRPKLRTKLQPSATEMIMI